MVKHYDYILVGHGIAGAVLAQQLLAREKTVLVFDVPNENKSSLVAAGLYNPVTGRKMVKTWLADELFPYLATYYEELEKTLNSNFFHQIGIYRPFVDIAEFNDWEGKRTDPLYGQFIDDVANDPNSNFLLNDPFGGLHLKLSGYLNIPELLAASRTDLVARDAYREEKFQETELTTNNDKILYRSFSSDRIIFCNGLGAQGSKFFDWLPFKPVKGEVLNIRPTKPAVKIYNRGVFYLPIDDSMARVGATYKNQFDNLEPTEEGKLELRTKLGQLICEDYKIIDVSAGIRPATKDRRPFIGKHFEYEHIYVFNGFGSKGVSLVPYFANQFVEHLEDNSPLNVEIDVKRYAHLYSSD